MVKQHIIELNGQLYDTTTGQTVTNRTPPGSNSTAKTTGKKSLDGFARPVKSAARHHNPVKSHAPEKSHTLMRRTVHKPVPAKTVTARPKKVRAEIVASGARLAHAKTIHKSKLITKFSEMVSKPEIGSAHNSGHLKPLINSYAKHAQKLTAASSPITERALAAASSHTQPRLKRTARHVSIAQRLHISPRIVSGGAFVLAGLLIASFFTLQNIPNINMRLASARAGIQGSLPAYQPGGFGLSGGINYQPGQIIIGYKSNTDNRNFKIIQSASNWNSESLRENYETLKTSSSKIEVPDKGKTVYIYNGSNATWIDGGIWYRIEGDSKLTSNQLLSLANSL